MDSQTQFARGDKVIHPRRPEWGDGQVLSAMTINHEGKAGQRLTVRFANQGQVTINTAIVPLVHKETVSTMSSTSSYSHSGQGWLDTLSRDANGHELFKLPEELTDPFATLEKRFEATLRSIKMISDGRDPRALLDWAVVQTGLNDPLSKYSRPELEQAFPRFARDREHHLVSLIKQFKAKGQMATVQNAQRIATSPAVKAALQRAISR